MDKAVRGACKPKHSPPKAKYIDSIVSSTFQTDGSFQEACRALSAKLKDPNSTVVFKALIVVHTLVRSGSQDVVLGYLSGTKMLGLESVISGYDTAQNLNKYASYLDRRIRTYGAIKYDIIRDKGERRGERDGIKGCNRLRSLTVDRGLLRETTLLQKQMDALTECKFYTDDMSDDVTMTALRLLVKDLLFLFQAVNEGVINVLENYFEMSHVDASTSLKIYKRFCQQTEKVVAYLGVAKKMQNVINVPIPNLKHAPVSLAGSLEEYLADPNFERNREEYKENKRVADGLPPTKKSSDTSPNTENKSSTGPERSRTPPNNKTFTDFFASINSEQTNMFNPQTGSPTMNYFQQQATFNPFLNRQMTGFPGQQSLNMQPTGYPSINGGMMQMPQLQAQPTGFAMGGITSQPTGYQAMLAPQQTGYNPFRQSMMAQPTGMMPSSSPFPQTMGMPASSSAPNLQSMQTGGNPFGSTFNPQQQQAPSPFGNPGQASSSSPFTQISQAQPQQQSFDNNASQFGNSPFNQPTSAAATSQPQQSSFLSPPAPAPLVAQPTGSRNPFAPPPGSAPSETQRPKDMSMNQLAMNAFQNRNNSLGVNGYQPQQQQQQQPPTQPLQSQHTGGGGLMASLASSFTGNQQQTGTTGSALFSSSSATPGISAPTNFSGVSAFSNSPAPSPLLPQATGYGGSLVKPFKPSSSFGTSLADSLPPLTAQPTGISMSNSPAPGNTATGASSTNAPAFNPFRSSTMGSTPSLSAQPTGFAPGGVSAPFSNAFSASTNGTTAPFGSTAFGSQFGTQNNQQQQSLI